MLRTLLLFTICLACITTARAVPIAGKVIGPDDKPVAGAAITIIRGYDTDNPITATTDAGGIFKAELEPVRTGTANFGVATAYAPPLAFASTSLQQGDNVIKLERAATAQGVVQDKAGKPVADAIVTLRYIKALHPQEDGSGYVGVPLSLSSKFTVKSGADGQWFMPGIAVSKIAVVTLDDPRFARAEAEAKPGAEAVAARLTALPGANLTGRVIHEDGTPAGGIQVHTYGVGSAAHSATAADGTYTLTSLATQVVAVVAHDPSGKLVALAVYGVQAKAGETVKVPNLVLTEGALVEGQVTDQAAGTPLPDVPVMGYIIGPDQVQTPASGLWRPVDTDKDGHFKLRVLPGKVGISIWGWLGKYLPLAKPVEFEIGKGETKTVPVQLVKGLSASGTVTNAAGKPIAEAEFSAAPHPVVDPNEVGTHTYLGPKSTKADGNGNWTLDGLQAGQWDVTGKGDWEVVSPKQIVVPLTATVKVTVRPIQWQTLKGRVLTPDHKPLAGAKIKAALQMPESGYGAGWRISSQQALTDAQGQYAIEKLRPGTKVSNLTIMPGYKYVAGGKVTSQENGFTAQDLIVTPLTAKLEGRVVDTAGQPVAGAQVMSPDGDLKAPATSDAGGKFVLTGLPEAPVMVIAGYKNLIGEAREVNSHQPLNLTLAPLKLPPSHDTQRAYEILDDLWATTEGDAYHRSIIPATLAPFAPDLALKMAAKQDGSVDDAILSRIIIDYARADPAHAAQWAMPRLNQMRIADGVTYTKLSLALAIAKVNPAAAQELYQQVKASLVAQLAKNPNDQQSILIRAVILTPLARMLGLQEEANQFIQPALAMVKATKDRTWILSSLASVEYDETAKMLDELPAPRRGQILHQAVIESVKYDLPLARRWLVKLTETEKQGSNGGSYTGTATQSLIKAIGKTDPAEALALARSVPDANKPLSLAMAAQFQTKEVALQALHEAADLVLGQQFGNLETISRIAAQAYELDPKFGSELFETARGRMESAQVRDNSLDTYGYDRNGAAFAFYYSRVDPAASRLILETEFARHLQQPTGDTNNAWQFNGELRSIAAAMAAVDVERALELSLMIPLSDPQQGDFSQAGAQRRIAQYLLLSEAERRNKPFQEWNVVDEAD